MYLSVGCGMGLGTGEQTDVQGESFLHSQHVLQYCWIDCLSRNVWEFLRIFSKVNSELLSGTSHVNTQVTNGVYYCYATTAVSSRQRKRVFDFVWDVEIPS